MLRCYLSLRQIWGGCPQGSILGVFLFNTTIDDLEEDCQDLTDEAPGVGFVEDEDEGDWEDFEEAIDSAAVSTPSKEGGRLSKLDGQPSAFTRS